MILQLSDPVRMTCFPALCSLSQRPPSEMFLLQANRLLLTENTRWKRRLWRSLSNCRKDCGNDFGNAMTLAMKDTLTQLVGIDSVSSRSNLEIANYLVGRCETKRLTVRRF